MATVIETFTVPFVLGKERPRFSRGHAYTPTRTLKAMDEIAAAWGDRPKAPSGTPVTVAIRATRPLPKSRPKSVEVEPDTFKPDLDNIAKLVLDGLNGRAWEDDAQVTHLSVSKTYRIRHGYEGMSICVMWEVDDEQE